MIFKKGPGEVKLISLNGGQRKEQFSGVCGAGSGSMEKERLGLKESEGVLVLDVITTS